MKNNLDFNYVDYKDTKDVFGAYLLNGAEYEGLYDIPVLEVDENIHLPSKLISYEKINHTEIKEYTYVHFYQQDYTFDGQYGIWNSLIQNRQFKRGFNLQKLNGVYAVICPDYSTYNDMPKVMQIWNVYRSRTTGYF